MRIELWALGTYCGIDIAQAVALGCYEVDSFAQQYLAVDVKSLGSGVGEVVAYVAHIGGTKQGVAYSMNQNVGIAMAKQAEGVVEAYAAKSWLAALYKFVDIISKPGTNVH